ncbi:MAG: uroporphyrinogen decarboxylase family protein [Candidatus Coatesbacteria bacterium]
MRDFKPFTEVHKLDWEALVRNIRRQGTPSRVFNIELFQDWEIEEAVDQRYGVTRGLDRSAPDFGWKRSIAMQRFLGYEWVGTSVGGLDTGEGLKAEDTTEAGQKRGERKWIHEDKGLITNWEELEKYPWPKVGEADTRALEWFEKHLPDDMCIVARQGHFCEYLCWLMGYETLCIALHEDRPLLAEITKRVVEREEAWLKVMLQSKRVKITWASDDLGFKTQLLFSPKDMREFVLPGHKRLAAMSHAAGHPYILHACGCRAAILEDLIEDVKLDGIHSWEDTIEKITDAKVAYGHRLSLLGGLDLDFLIRADEERIRSRVRETVKTCQPGGGFCLGTGNTVANYIPLDNYLAMLDEGRKL